MSLSFASSDWKQLVSYTISSLSHVRRNLQICVFQGLLLTEFEELFFFQMKGKKNTLGVKKLIKVSYTIFGRWF